MKFWEETLFWEIILGLEFCLSLVVALRQQLRFDKSKVKNEITEIKDAIQNIGYPDNPMEIPSNNCRDTDNEKKTEIKP